jgi:hypothetical protein
MDKPLLCCTFLSICVVHLMHEYKRLFIRQSAGPWPLDFMLAWPENTKGALLTTC